MTTPSPETRGPETRGPVGAMLAAGVTLMACPVCGVDIVATVDYDATVGTTTPDALDSATVTLTTRQLRVSHACRTTGAIRGTATP